MPQTSIVVDPPVAVAGMLADGGPSREVISRALATAAGIPAGTVVSYSSATECKAPAAATDIGPGPGVALGIAIKQFYTRESGAPDYAQRSMVSILTKGRIWMVCDTDIAVTDPLFIVHSGASAGRPSKTDDATTTPLAVGAIRCLTPALAGALGQFEISLP